MPENRTNGKRVLAIENNSGTSQASTMNCVNCDGQKHIGKF